MTQSSQLSEADVDDGLDALVHRVETTLEDTGSRFPFFADGETGRWETTEDGNWCGGHWIGLLWIASDVADGPNAERFSRAARAHTDVLRERMATTSMFCGMNFRYAGFRGYDVTGDRSLYGLGLTGADAMVDLFDERARQVVSGTFRVEGGGSFADTDDPSVRARTSAVDNVYTALPVLWRAYRETGNTRFRDVALSHADRHLDWFLRDDGATWHHAEFDPETGGVTDRGNALGYSDETCWARGLGWHIAGLARAYEETGAKRYRDALERSVDYYLANVPDDLIPYWDLEDPSIPDAPRDTSAAALAAYGLVRLSSDSRLRTAGEEILASLIESYTITDADDPRRGMVRHGCYDKPGEYATDNELIWTNYYVAYALYSLSDQS